MSARDFAKAVDLKVELHDEKDLAIFTNSSFEASPQKRNNERRKASICDLSLFEPPTTTLPKSPTHSQPVQINIEPKSPKSEFPTLSSATTYASRSRNLSAQSTLSKSSSHASFSSNESHGTWSTLSHENPMSNSTTTSFEFTLETKLSNLTLNYSDDEDVTTPTQSNVTLGCHEDLRGYGYKMVSMVNVPRTIVMSDPPLPKFHERVMSVCERDPTLMTTTMFENQSRSLYSQNSQVCKFNEPRIDDSLLDGANFKTNNTKQYSRGRFIVTEIIN
ncbi:hypothetical protein HK098_006718 [Nowakowskiella sp. JEL0407]|nr:hypothetical protein HK098_006718 [Nowakowskiella sp. JEL0407]